MTGKALFQDGVSLRFKGVSEVEKAINFPPCLRNRLFPKLVHSALGVLGVSDPVPVDLDEFETREGWMLDIRIEQKGGT